MPRRFHTLDVFTDTKTAGNPLAVVHDCDGLDTAAMQAIAREFNLSETVFVLPPVDPVNTARIRIFTPGSELPSPAIRRSGRACCWRCCARPSWCAAPASSSRWRRESAS